MSFYDKDYYIYFDAKVVYWEGFIFKSKNTITKQGFFAELYSSDFSSSRSGYSRNWSASIDFVDSIHSAKSFSSLEVVKSQARNLKGIIYGMLTNDKKNIETAYVDYKIMEYDRGIGKLSEVEF